MRPGPGAPLRPPPKCNGCQTAKVAWSKPRVDYCYACLPGGPFTPPPCRACGSTAYFSQGLCEACHPGGPRFLSSCTSCLAWGVFRQHNWMCWTCRWWATHFPTSACDYCGRISPVGDAGACRLCLEQARMLHEPGHGIDLAGANKHGQQMFLANMPTPTQVLRPPPPPRRPRRRPSAPTRSFAPVDGIQGALFAMTLDPQIVTERARWEDGELTRHCHQIVREHAAKHGWSTRQRNDVVRSLRLLQTYRSRPEERIRVTDVLTLPTYAGNIVSTMDVLEAAGLLVEDRIPRIQTYFTTKTRHLPQPMRAQLETWLSVMIDGSSTAPRRRRRAPVNIRQQIHALTPILTDWAAQGTDSLAAVTPGMVTDALPAFGHRRATTVTGMRSLFSILKSRKVTFQNPARALANPGTAGSTPLPLDTAAVRAALASSDPAVALAVALVVFHALTNLQVRRVQLTDIADGRLQVGDRSIPLADLVRPRLRAWLDHRAKTWPSTINPYLFVTQRSAPRLVHPGTQFPWNRTTLRPQALREDRILAEAHASGGDVRRLCDLFGMSVEGASRYTVTQASPIAPLNHGHEPESR